MPNADASTDRQRFDLKTLEGAYVIVRKFTYGEELHIRSISARLHIAQREQAKRLAEARAKGEKAEDTAEMSFEMEAVTAFQFSRAIVEHNLTHGDGSPYNFANRADIHRLDKRVGEEIEEFILEFNPDVRQSEEEEGDSPLPSASTAPSSQEPSPTTT